jgi:tRNA-dihydrouridine synthase B
MQLLAEHHGEYSASRLARKHVVWYSKGLRGSAEFRGHFQRIETWQEQIEVAGDYFLGLKDAVPLAA